MKVLLVFLIITSIQGNGYDSSVWEETKKFSNDIYSFEYPSGWKEVKKDGFEIYLNASGVGITDFFNGGPFDVFVYVKKLDAAGRQEVVEEVKAMYPEIPEWYFYNPEKHKHVKKEDLRDFFFPEFYEPVISDYELPGAAESFILKGRSYEQGLRFHQRRQELIFKASADGSYRVLSVIMKFNDKTFSVEKSFRLDDYFSKVISGLEIR